MDKQLADYFFQEVSKAFAFLVDEHAFAMPQLQVDDKINFVFVTFMGKNLAVECILDEREDDVTCKIARVVGGKETSHYAVDESGRRVREYLSKLLERRGVREQLFTQVGGLEIHERIRITLADFAEMLRRHGKEILDDSPSALV